MNDIHSVRIHPIEKNVMSVRTMDGAELQYLMMDGKMILGSLLRAQSPEGDIVRFFQPVAGFAPIVLGVDIASDEPAAPTVTPPQDTVVLGGEKGEQFLEGFMNGGGDEH